MRSDKFECVCCGEVFDSHIELRHHERTNHAEPDVPTQ